MAQTELSLETVAGIVEARVRQRMILKVEEIIREQIKPHIQALAEDVVSQTIGQAKVYFAEDHRLDQLKVQIVFPGVDK